MEKMRLEEGPEYVGFVDRNEHWENSVLILPICKFHSCMQRDMERFIRERERESERESEMRYGEI
jgi:hypothetical protein